LPASAVGCRRPPAKYALQTIQKNKSREQIIDELEMDEEGVKVLDNLEEYRAVAESAIRNP
jgi:hypothetical protein